MSHPVPDLAPEAVEAALELLGYIEPELDIDLPEAPQPRLCSLLTILLAVTEAHLRQRDCLLDEAYFAVSDHLAEENCRCSFFPAAEVPAPRAAREGEGAQTAPQPTL